MTNHKVVGVLALQGGVVEHLSHFKRAVESSPEQYGPFQLEFIEVKTSDQLHRCNALVIPGGESTAISLIAERTGLLAHLYEFVADESKVIWGTCAGLILLAKQVENAKRDQKILGGMDIKVIRNAFGRQLDSFESNLDFSSFIPNLKDFPTIFIRAPIVDQILNENPRLNENLTHPPVPMAKLTDGITVRSENPYSNSSPVEILHRLENGFIVAVKQGNKLGTSFHPELSENFLFHKWFLDTFVLAD
ncbi:hypothetical protein QCA50_015679 [Cerrena zonata]|uniref:glutaminase n=1 Tax=Cerrena zonata TaxID=2478898 RepID=A0AAW0FM96_9APHY